MKRASCACFSTRAPRTTPAKANIGRLQSLTSLLPGYLMAQLEQSAHLKLIDARNYRLPIYSELSPDAAVQRAQDPERLNTQYPLTASIDSLSTADQRSLGGGTSVQTTDLFGEVFARALWESSHARTLWTGKRADQYQLYYRACRIWTRPG